MKKLANPAGLLLLLTMLLAACSVRVEPTIEPAQVSGKVTGSVTYRERIALPPDAVVRVALLDVSRMDVAATLIAETVIVPEHAVPIPFELAYDPEKIDPRMVYAVRATILRGDNYLFVTDTHYPVLTRGHGETADLVLKRSGGGAAAVAPAHLTNTRWLLRALDGEAIEIGVNQRAPFLQFENQGEAAIAHGYSGCNSFTGRYLVAGATLSFENMISTLRACEDMRVEDRFLGMLGEVAAFRIESTWLILSGDSGELATFEAWYE